jgi:hypothetical protein
MIRSMATERNDGLDWSVHHGLLLCNGCKEDCIRERELGAERAMNEWIDDARMDLCKKCKSKNDKWLHGFDPKEDHPNVLEAKT